MFHGHEIHDDDDISDEASFSDDEDDNQDNVVSEINFDKSLPGAHAVSKGILLVNSES